MNNILEIHKHHHSVHKISQTFMSNEKFSFQFVTEYQLKLEIMNLDGSKATPIGDMSVDILKSTEDIHLPFITKSINLSFKIGCLSKELKRAEVSPVFKKKGSSIVRDLEKIMYRLCKRKLIEAMHRILKKS